MAMLSVVNAHHSLARYPSEMVSEKNDDFDGSERTYHIS